MPSIDSTQTLNWRADDDASLHARLIKASNGSGEPPALLLHSLFFDGTMFDCVLPALAVDRDCIIPDHRGQGKSEAGDRIPTCARLAQDMIALCDRCDVPEVHIVGSSMGAYVGMDMLRLAPARIASLAISCCTCDAEPKPERFDDLVAFLGSEDRPQLANRIASLMFSDTFLQDESMSVKRERWLSHFADLPRSIGAVAAAMFAHDGYRDVLAATDTPVLAIAGREDKAKKPADLEWIGSSGRGRFTIFEESGHTPPLETPAAYTAEVFAFLKQTSAGTA